MGWILELERQLENKDEKIKELEDKIDSLKEELLAHTGSKPVEIDWVELAKKRDLLNKEITIRGWGPDTTKGVLRGFERQEQGCGWKALFSQGNKYILIAIHPSKIFELYP